MRHIKAIKSKPPWRVLFFGTDEFSVKTLQGLSENMMMPNRQGHVVGALDVVHPIMKKTTVVNRYAQMCGLRQLEWPLESKSIQNRYDVAVLASFGHLIPSKIVESFPYGILNVHPSLLPLWRGAAPLHHTVLSGALESGVSIMAIQPKRFDIGPILDQKVLPLSRRPNWSTLRESMAHEGGKLIIQVLHDLPSSILGAKEQDYENVSYAHKITKQNSFINWNLQTMDEIDRQYRSIYETMELRTQWQGTTVRLMDKADPSLYPLVELDMESPPGLPVFDKRNEVIHIRCKDGWVAFKRIIIKKKMSAKAFFNGYLSKEHLKGVCFSSVENSLFNEDYKKWTSNPRPS